MYEKMAADAQAAQAGQGEQGEGSANSENNRSKDHVVDAEFEEVKEEKKK
jgi:hypothetical protein